MRVRRSYELELRPWELHTGDQITISLAGFGTFTATVCKDTDNALLVLFDDCVEVRPINRIRTNEGGFEGSDLKKWMESSLLPAFPEDLKDIIYGLTIPSMGQLEGHESSFYRFYSEPDMNEPLPGMEKRKHRIGYFKNQPIACWLRNASANNSEGFLNLTITCHVITEYATCLHGVRPEFWLPKRNR